MDEVARPVVSRRVALKYEVIALTSLHAATIARGLLGSGTRSARSDIYIWTETLIRVFSVAGSALIVLFVIWASGDSLEQFGIKKWRWNTDPAYMLIAFCSMYAIHVFYSSLMYGHFSLFGSYRPIAGFTKSYLLGVPLYLLVGFREELFFRGYLITRFGELFKR
jgi:membrane protease YdiL (CAAX protease family)